MRKISFLLIFSLLLQILQVYVANTDLNVYSSTLDLSKENVLSWSNQEDASFYMPMLMSNRGIVVPLSRKLLKNTSFILPQSGLDGNVFVQTLDSKGRVLRTSDCISLHSENETCSNTLVLKVGSVNFSLNGKQSPDVLPVPCQIIEGRTMLVVRKPLEAIGAEVKYDEIKNGKEVEKRVTISFDDYIVQVWIGRNYGMFKEKGKTDFVKKQIDPNNPAVKPTIIKGSMLLPLRSITEGIGVLNSSSMWNGTTKTITLIFNCLSSNDPCCDLLVEKTSTTPEILEAGAQSVVEYKITNKSDKNCMVVMDKPWKNVLYITPDTSQGPIDLAPGDSQNIQVFVMMPYNSNTTAKEDFSFSVGTLNCRENKNIDFSIGYDKTLPTACCDFQAEIAPSDLALGYCEGAEGFVNLSLTNPCKEEGHSYFLTDDANLLQILPSSIVVAPNSTENVQLKFTMPPKGGLKEANFSLNVVADCQSEKKIDFKLAYSTNCLPDCDWLLEQVTDTMAFSKNDGEQFQVRYKVTNNSKSKKSFNIQMNNPEALAEPSTFDVESGESSLFNLNCVMLPGVNPGDFANYTGVVSSDCNLPSAIDFKILKPGNASSGCCDYTATAELSANAQAGLCPTDTGHIKYKFTNTCTDPGSKFIINFANLSNADLIFPTSIELASGETKDVLVLFTMPPQGMMGTDPADISFEAETSCGKKSISEKISYSTNCSMNPPTPPPMPPPDPGQPYPPQPPTTPGTQPPVCCNFFVSMVSNSFGSAGVCAGSTGTIKYKIKNLCQQDQLDFEVVVGGDVTSSNPPTLSIPPGTEQEFEITFTMPQGTDPVAGILFSLRSPCSYDALGQVVPYCTTGGGTQPPPACCTYSASLDSSVTLNPLGYCPGDSIPLKVLVTNTCQNPTDVINFNFAPSPDISSVASPTDFTVQSSQSSLLEFTAVVPQNSSGAQTFDIGYVLTTQCGINNEKITINYDTSGTCSPPPTNCNWNYSLSNLTPIPSGGLCSGDAYSLVFDVSNTSTNPSDLVSFNAILGPDVTNINPMTFDVMPGASQSITVDFAMPIYSGVSPNANISFSLSPSCGTPQQVSTQIPYTSSCMTCCSYLVTPPATTQGATLACNAEQDFMYQFKNNCSNRSFVVTLLPHAGTNIVGIVPNTFTVNPNQTSFFAVRAKMPPGTPAGTIIQCAFDIKVTGCQTVTESFDITAATCGTGQACTWNLVRPSTTNLSLCPGSRLKLTYGIENTSASGFITFNMSQFGITSPVTFTPSSLTVNSGETKQFEVEFVMDPQMLPPLLSQIQFAVTPSCVSAPETENFVVQCLSCSFDIQQSPGTNLSVCPGGTGTASFMAKNKCDSQPLDLNLSSLACPEITSISPNSLTIPPGGTVNFTVDFIMPGSLPFGAQYGYTFDVVPSCGSPPQTVNFSATNGCSWQLTEPSSAPLAIPAGTGNTFSYTVTNNCTADLKFDLIPSSAEITGFTSQGNPITSFVVPAGGTYTFEAQFVMDIACVQGNVTASFDMVPSDPNTGALCQTKNVSIQAICSPNSSTCDWSPIVNTTVPPLGIRLLAGDSMLIDYQIDVTSTCNLTTVSIIPSMGSGQMSFVDTSTGLAITSITINGPGIYKFSQLITMPSTALPYDMVEFYFTLKNTGTGEIVPGGVNAYCQ